MQLTQKILFSSANHSAAMMYGYKALWIIAGHVGCARMLEASNKLLGRILGELLLSVSITGAFSLAVKIQKGSASETQIGNLFHTNTS